MSDSAEDRQKCPFKHCDKYFLPSGHSALITHLTLPEGKEGGHDLHPKKAYQLVDRRKINYIRRLGENRRKINEQESLVSPVHTLKPAQTPIIKDLAPPLSKDPQDDNVSLEKIEKDFGKDSKVYELAQRKHNEEKKKHSVIEGAKRYQEYLDGWDGFGNSTVDYFSEHHSFNEKKGIQVLKGDRYYHAFCETCKDAAHFMENPGRYFTCISTRK